MQDLLVVKIGGEVLDHPETLEFFLTKFARLSSPKILVHGGGKIASRLAKQLGISPRIVEGRRITDAAMLEVAIMVYAGLLNKRIVAGLQKRGCPAIGLSGADAASIRAVRRNPHPIDFGYVGDVETVNVPVIRSLLALKLVPVFASLTYSREGDLLNTNADTIATALARALSAFYHTQLFFLLQRPGVLLNPRDDRTLIPRLSYRAFLRLKKEGNIRDGMIPKLDNGFAALQGGVRRVFIGHFRQFGEWPIHHPVFGTELILNPNDLKKE